MKHTTILLGSTLLLATQLQSVALGQVCGFEDQKILASDGAPDSRFGASMGVSGSTAIIGAPSDDGNGFNYGAAYIFTMSTGVEIRKLTASPGAAAAFFGSSVAIQGVQALIGAPNDRLGTGLSTGSAYLFSTIIGSQLHRYDPSDGVSGDDFGAAVALSGNVVAIGSPMNLGTMGSVYLYDRVSGAQLFKLVSPNALTNDLFGSTLAMDGTKLAVGSPVADVGGGGFMQTGLAHVFDTTTGAATLVLFSTDSFSGDHFGTAVDIGTNRVAVGAPFNSTNGVESGAVYIFDATTGGLLLKLVPSSIFSTSHSEFGTSVTIDGNRVIVGAPKMSTGSGESFLFDLTTGEQLGELKASDPFINDYFGQSVTMNNFGILVGAFLEDDNGAQGGAAYRFDPNPTSCPADLTGDCTLNFFDVSTFLSAFAASDPVADFNNDGAFNFFDVSAFLGAFSAGCP